MNMQQMLMQANKMQRELQKAMDALHEKDFTVSKGGAVTVVVKGNKKVSSISIDKDAFDADNKEMVEEMVAVAINEAHDQISAEEAEINQRITGRANGLF